MKIPIIFKSIILGIPVGITFVDCFGYVARVDGISMQPALNPDKNQTDYVFLNRWAVKSYDIKRGDIISLISPKDPGQKIIKRVVGVQGDIIQTLGYKNEVVKIPEGHCWIEGDHTGHSMDSNNFGPVSIGLVTAKACCIVWPPSRWQMITSSLPETRKPLNLVNRIELEFTGNVVRNALCLGDVDNDGYNELVIGNEKGDVAIFKGKEKIQSITKLSFITCIAVGDILNHNKNSLVIITADGWCYIYETPEVEDTTDDGLEEVDGQMNSTSSLESSDSSFKKPRKYSASANDNTKLICVHVQRIPANAKNILIGDIDNDGMIEMVLGLTDRVVRSYKWFANTHKHGAMVDASIPNEIISKPLGKFVAMNKWECANQIGSITLHHAWDGKPSLLVAQPGGTFMRIQCQLELTDKLDSSDMSKSNSSHGENIPGSIDYQFLGISRMRNQNISTEILGDFRCFDGNIERSNSNSSKSSSKSSITKGRPYAVATLDGTIMLVQDEVISWAIAVDHQIFALTKLDVTGNGCDDIVVCSWDGQTYILDQDKNCIRFLLDEPVQAFDSGYYNLNTNEPSVTCLVYVTFKNTIILYYDIPIKELVCKRFEPNIDNLSELFVYNGKAKEEAVEICKKMDKKSKKELVEYLLYNSN